MAANARTASSGDVRTATPPPAASDATRDRLCPMTSCISCAMRARSATAAARAIWLCSAATRCRRARTCRPSRRAAELVPATATTSVSRSPGTSGPALGGASSATAASTATTATVVTAVRGGQSWRATAHSRTHAARYVHGGGVPVTSAPTAARTTPATAAARAASGRRRRTTTAAWTATRTTSPPGPRRGPAWSETAATSAASAPSHHRECRRSTARSHRRGSVVLMSGPRVRSDVLPPQAPPRGGAERAHPRDEHEHRRADAVRLGGEPGRAHDVHGHRRQHVHDARHGLGQEGREDLRTELEHAEVQGDRAGGVADEGAEHDPEQRPVRQQERVREHAPEHLGVEERDAARRGERAGDLHEQVEEHGAHDGEAGGDGGGHDGLRQRHAGAARGGDHADPDGAAAVLARHGEHAEHDEGERPDRVHGREAERDVRGCAVERRPLEHDVPAQAEDERERGGEGDPQRAHGPDLGPLGAEQAGGGDPRPGEIGAGLGQRDGGHRAASVTVPYSTASRVICMNASSRLMRRVASSYRAIPRAAASAPISRAERPWTSRLSRSSAVTLTSAPCRAVASAAASGETTRTVVGATDAMTSWAVPAARSRPWPMTTRSSAMSDSSLMRCEERNTVRPPAARSASVRRTHSTPSGSSPLTGSSSTSTCGSPSRAAAIPSR